MSRYQPRVVLITGGAGFIGSNFVRHMLATDPSVHLISLDKLTYAGCRENLADLPDSTRHALVVGDICDGALVRRLLRDHAVDTVVHFAAESHVDRSISGPGAFVETNLTGTFVILEACRELWPRTASAASSHRFHHISTDEVYGALGPGDPAFTERTPYAPNSPYAASKAGSDHLVRAYHHTYGLPVTTSNCSNNYGPYQHAEKFIPTVIRACLTGQPIPLYGDGSNIRDWLYVDDHCAAIARVLYGGALGETYNIGGGNEWSNIGIAREVCRQMDEQRPLGAPHDRLIAFVTDRPGHDWRYAIDSSKMRQELGWTPSETFASGIQRSCRWYCEREALGAGD